MTRRNDANQLKHLKHLIGRKVVAVKRDGTRVSGRLVKIKGDRAYIQMRSKQKKARVKALIPLILYDILAVGGPGFGPYGPGAGGYGFGPYGPGAGGPKFGPYGPGAAGPKFGPYGPGAAGYGPGYGVPGYPPYGSWGW